MMGLEPTTFCMEAPSDACRWVRPLRLASRRSMIGRVRVFLGSLVAALALAAALYVHDA